ncbi:mevalonate kinase [Neobacillus mesonae]|uniref:mevalonate kinase n=1 Tax=Neobacillus mesonae TaxID=1193713 RepID=UPI00203FE7E1|nr:mevalonate kinase [Neobacillus mesonae]MCM3571215.1 mevalonate kinase [Neobacillus mesonae]
MVTCSTKSAVGLSHSKIILTGEHAVVYGIPAIAIPFPLEVKAEIRERAEEIVLDCAHFKGPLHKVPKKLMGIAACINETLLFLQKPLKGLKIRIHSSIPIGRGLGSSAAIAIAVVRGLFAFFGKEAGREELLALVQKAEIYAHGNPSGIDMEAASSNVPIWFQKGKEVIPLKAGAPLHIVAADTGRVGDTHKAVKNVKEKYVMDSKKTKDSLKRIEEITFKTRTALEIGNIRQLGELLNMNHKELMTLGVSDDGLNLLVKAANDAGALGAKLTGGGQGGCIIALANSMQQGKEIADCLLNAGAAKTWHFTAEY